MSAWPMDLVKGRRNISRERQDVENTMEGLQDKINAIRDKVQCWGLVYVPGYSGCGDGDMWAIVQWW